MRHTPIVCRHTSIVCRMGKAISQKNCIVNFKELNQLQFTVIHVTKPNDRITLLELIQILSIHALAYLVILIIETNLYSLTL